MRYWTRNDFVWMPNFKHLFTIFFIFPLFRHLVANCFSYRINHEHDDDASLVMSSIMAKFVCTVTAISIRISPRWFTKHQASSIKRRASSISPSKKWKWKYSNNIMARMLYCLLYTVHSTSHLPISLLIYIFV